jgi:hypothetical protein
MVAALLETGQHTITALTREDSEAIIPEGVKIAKINYDDHSSLVAALQGQDALIITMNTMAPQDTSFKLVNAAADAGVPWILPNEWGCDQTNEKFADEIFLGPASRAVRSRIEELGKSSWVGLACGFWYEFSLGGSPSRYGFDFDKKTVTLFDEGRQPLNTTTWPQVGRAVAALLSLRIQPGGADGKESVTLSTYKNKFVYVSSFHITQREMLESVLRVTGAREEDWQITYEDSKERYQRGMGMLQSGNMEGFVIAMYTRHFFPGDSGSFQDAHPLDNEKIGLPVEDLDESTRKAVEMGLASKVNGHKST